MFCTNKNTILANLEQMFSLHMWSYHQHLIGLACEALFFVVIKQLYHVGVY